MIYVQEIISSSNEWLRLQCCHLFELEMLRLGKICFITVSLLLFPAGSMYQYFVKIVPTMYRKLNGEVSPKKKVKERCCACSNCPHTCMNLFFFFCRW